VEGIHQLRHGPAGRADQCRAGRRPHRLRPADYQRGAVKPPAGDFVLLLRMCRKRCEAGLAQERIGVPWAPTSKDSHLVGPQDRSGGSPGSTTSAFTVTGSHTYAAAGPYAVTVTLSHEGVTTTIKAIATVTSLGQGVVSGLAGGIGFWQNGNGQALINIFNGGSTATALAPRPAPPLPHPYRASAGANNLTGKTNAQVAAFYLSQFALSGPKVQAQALATALNVHATTTSLGGNAGVAYGFSVSATGLGARSFNVGQDGAPFGVA